MYMLKLLYIQIIFEYVFIRLKEINIYNIKRYYHITTIMEKEHIIKYFYCKKCDYNCKTLFCYERHIKSGKHINGKITRTSSNNEKLIHKCNICNFTSDHLYNFKSHLLNNHSTNDEKKKEFTYYCEYCNTGMFAESVFKKHISSKKHLIKSKNI